ncbi:MAG: transcription antitermination factor NusB [Clostridia bacterium]|nr:transcription antitermination factor NusB [Clostridia bacterium]
MAEEKMSAREQAFIIVFEKSFNSETSFDELIEFSAGCENLAVSEKAKRMIAGIDENFGEIDGIIESHLNNWKMSRISKVALAALRIGVYELSFSKSAPVGVTVSECVNICNKYGTHDDKSFVNGVLGSVARDN